MAETVKLKETELKDHILKTVQPLIEDTCGRIVAEKIEESMKQSFEKHAQDTERGYPAWLKKAQAQEPPKLEIKREKGHAMARWARAMVVANNDIEKCLHILGKWGDHDIQKAGQDMVQKADAMMASNPELGGYLVPPDVSSDYVELLKPLSVIRRLGANVIPMPSGNYEIPKITSGSTAYYQGESENITPSQVKTGMLRLIFKKLTNLVPVSNDLLRFSSPGADGIVRDDMLRGSAARENQAFIRDNGIDGTPKGILNWAAPANSFAAAASVSVANTTLDLGKMVLALMNSDVPMTRPAWLMNPKVWNYLVTETNTNGFFVFRDEMVNRQTLWGWPFAVTTTIPGNLGSSANESELYLVDMADAIVGESLSPRVDSSSVAAYYDGSSVVAAFSKDQTVIRVIVEHDFLMRRGESVAVLTGVGWGN